MTQFSDAALEMASYVYESEMHLWGVTWDDNDNVPIVTRRGHDGEWREVLRLTDKDDETSAVRAKERLGGIAAMRAALQAALGAEGK